MKKIRAGMLRTLNFMDGQPVGQVVGALPKGALKRKIDSVLGT